MTIVVAGLRRKSKKGENKSTPKYLKLYSYAIEPYAFTLY